MPPGQTGNKNVGLFLTDTYRHNTGVYHCTFLASQPSARIDYIFANKYIKRWTIT